MVYFEEPDTHGHAFGPESKIVFNFLQLLDNITLYLEVSLKRNKSDLYRFNFLNVFSNN